jgi:glyoxylate reductase
MRVLVMQEVAEAGLAELDGFELVRGSDPAGFDGVVCYLVDPIDEAFLATPGLRGLGTVSVGLDHIDLAAADRHGIPIANTPDVLTESTADLTFALLLAAARRLGEAERYLRAGRWTSWSFDLLLGTDVHGKTLLVIGGGRIGKAVVRRAEGFGMRTVVVGRDRDELDRALGEADFVAVTVPLTAETRHLIGPRELALMKPTAILVNSSRGPVVDEAALAQALTSGTIAGAGLDVFEDEPRVNPDLLACENAVLVPHIGSATHETREGMAVLACRGLAQILRGVRPPNLANPQVWDRRSSG